MRLGYILPNGKVLAARFSGMGGSVLSKEILLRIGTVDAAVLEFVRCATCLDIFYRDGFYEITADKDGDFVFENVESWYKLQDDSNQLYLWRGEGHWEVRSHLSGTVSDLYIG